MSRSTISGEAGSRSRCRRTTAISDLDDAEEEIAERLDGSHYRDDILRLLFICCHPESAGDAADRAGAAHRLGADRETDRARFPGHAKPRWSSASPAPRPASPRPIVPFETPGAVERSERLASVAAMIYLIFNEGYSASGDTAEIRSTLVRGGDPAGAAAAAAVPERAGDHGPDGAVAAAACPRGGAVRRRWRVRAARRPGPQPVESEDDRRRGWR